MAASTDAGEDYQEALGHPPTPDYPSLGTTQTPLPPSDHMARMRQLPIPGTEITLLTLNTQKAGTNSPSLTDLVTILDLRTPDILLLTETPIHPHQ